MSNNIKELVRVRLLDNVNKVQQEMDYACVTEEDIDPERLLNAWVLDECGGELIDAPSDVELVETPNQVKAVAFCDRVYEVFGHLYLDTDAGHYYMDLDLFT